MTIDQIAALTGIEAIEIKLFAESIANSIEADKAVDGFATASEADKVEMVRAYSVVAQKKMASFVTAYLTNPVGREAFNRDVLEMLTA